MATKVSTAIKAKHITVDKKTLITWLPGAKLLKISQNGRTMTHTLEFEGDSLEKLIGALKELDLWKH